MRPSTRIVVLNSKKYALDLISAVAATAYSLRRLYASYTGAAIRVRRSSDNAERDIGFIGEHLDLFSLFTFVGSGNGFATTWYDQSGNGRHVSQATTANQPTYQATGLNNKPALHFNGGDFFNNISVSLPLFSVSLVETATQNTNVIYYPVGFGLGGISVGGSYFSQKFAINGSNSLVTTENSVLNAPTIVFAGSDNLGCQIAVNGNAPATDLTAQSITQISIGRRSDGFWPFFGSISEVIFFPSLLSTTARKTLERNQGIYFDISI
ncbi:alpha-L-arabinofuranosidase [Aphanizomenon phage vB_AphaS-CL131]|nr:alpha-L-arabinofuranosidase [Aphanizomenon phage vB_AphaS-CL131]